MENEQTKKVAQWYVMRAYKSEKTAEELLSGKHGLKHFIPKKQVLRTVNGRKVICMVPVIHSLIFVQATHQEVVDFKHYYYNDLQFVTWKHDGVAGYLTVPKKQMESFIIVCKQREEEVHFYMPNEINGENGIINIEKGKKVRVHGGPFDKVEGYFVKIAKKRNRQLVVIIPDLLVASAEVDPDFLEIIE